MPEETAVKASGQNMTQATMMKHSPRIVAQVTADKLGVAHQEKEATSYATVCNIHLTCSDYGCTQTGPYAEDADLCTRPAASVPYLLKERRCRSGLMGWR